jgi:beta-N-acetylhexosaminidase
VATASGSAVSSTASSALDLRDRLLLSFEGRRLAPAGAEAIARRAAGVTLYRHLNIGTPAEVRALADELQAAARRIGRPTPLLVGADHETGQLHAMGEGATPFPGAMALGAVGDEGLAERVAAAIGAELRAMGVNLVYSPVCDLATNARNPVVGIRSFGDDPAAVGRLAAATVRGLQSAGVAATVKHFPGHGDPAADSHIGLPVIDRSADELRERELVPFGAAIDAGARLAMAGHLGVPALTGRRDLPATLAPEILRTLLRGDLGFGGLTVSDALDMGAVSSDGGVDVAAALGAGTDLLLCGPDPEAQVRVEVGLAAARTGGLVGRIDNDAATARVADLRRWIAGFPDPPVDVVGGADHQRLAGEVASRSMTLIRDRAGLLPVPATNVRRVLVIEPRPRDLTPADTTSWLPPGGLAAALAERLSEVQGHVVEAAPTADEITALRERAASTDLVVLGTVDALGQPAVVDLARALVATGRPIVAVALRGPWDADAYPEIGTVLATYGIQPPSLAAAADAIVRDHQITGRLPVRLAGG